MLYVPPIVQGAIHTHKLISDQTSITASEYHIDLIGNILTANKTEYLTGLFVAQLEAALKSNKVDLNARTVVRADILQSLKAAVLTFRKRLVFDRIAKFVKEYGNEDSFSKYERVRQSGFVEEILVDLSGAGYDDLLENMRSKFLHGTVETNEPFVPRKFRLDKGMQDYVASCKLLINRFPKVPLVTNRRFDALNVDLPEPIEYIDIQPYSHMTNQLVEQKIPVMPGPIEMSYNMPTSVIEAAKFRKDLNRLLVEVATNGTPKSKAAADDLIVYFKNNLFNSDDTNPNFFVASIDDWKKVSETLERIKSNAQKQDGLSLPVLTKLDPTKENWNRIAQFLDNNPQVALAIESDDALQKIMDAANKKCKEDNFEAAFTLLKAIANKLI